MKDEFKQNLFTVGTVMIVFALILGFFFLALSTMT